MEVLRIQDFERSLKKLPPGERAAYDTQEQRFRENWLDPRLHVKKLRGFSDAFSFRVTRRYRVLFYFRDASTAIFFDIDHRKDAYR